MKNLKMFDSQFEIESIIASRKYKLGTRYSRKRADHMLCISKIKARSFCKRHGGFYLCKKCRGSGFILSTIYTFSSPPRPGRPENSVEIRECNNCKLTGLETWLDKMIGGWKGNV